MVLNHRFKTLFFWIKTMTSKQSFETLFSGGRK